MNATVSTLAPCKFLEWDSEFFGMRVGRVSGDTLSKEEVRSIDDWCEEERIRLLYFLSRADCPSSVESAEQAGFRLVDVRLTFELTGRPAEWSSMEGGLASVRPVRKADIPALQSLARAGHRNTRFFNDNKFPRELAEKLYATWIALDCEGRADKVLVATEDAGEVLGYVTCHLGASHGQIGLIGVNAEKRGKGLGRQLTLAASHWLKEKGASKILVVTQGSNIPAQRLYQSCGFRTHEVSLWYHKWYSPVEA